MYAEVNLVNITANYTYRHKYTCVYYTKCVCILQVNEGEFTVYLPVDTVMTITTLTGQEKGSFPNVPPSAQFPVPYSDTFDSMSNILTQVYIHM